MKRANLFTSVAISAAVTLLTIGCTDPDPGKAFDQYTEIVGEGSDGTQGLCDAENRDLSGLYFVRLQHSISPPDHILMSFDVTNSSDGYKIVVQPLKTDFTSDKIDELDENGDPVCRTDSDGNIVYEKDNPEQCRINQVNAPREDARTPAGNPIVVEGLTLDSNNELHIDLDQLRVDGTANSFTGGDILADIKLTVVGCVEDEAFICGKGRMDVFEPITFNNAKGNFGGVLVDEISSENVAPVTCDGEFL